MEKKGTLIARSRRKRRASQGAGGQVVVWQRLRHEKTVIPFLVAGDDIRQVGSYARQRRSHGKRCVYQGYMLRMVVAPERTSDNSFIAAKSFGGHNFDIPLWERSPSGGYPPITCGGSDSGPNDKQVKFAKGRPYCIE